MGVETALIAAGIAGLAATGISTAYTAIQAGEAEEQLANDRANAQAALDAEEAEAAALAEEQRNTMTSGGIFGQELQEGTFRSSEGRKVFGA